MHTYGHTHPHSLFLTFHPTFEFIPTVIKLSIAAAKCFNLE